VLGKNHPILTPTEKELAGVRSNPLGYSSGPRPDAGKLRDLHFDVLIALTARSHGARLITSNRRDFELISSYRKFRLEVW